MPPQTPQLSILIPTLDEAAWVAHAVRSARASLRAAGIDGEILVCDGGSRDTTVAQARRHADHVLVSSPGRSAQLNAGAEVARGEVLVMLHADALLSPSAVEGIVAAIDSGADGGWFQIAILPELQQSGAFNWHAFNWHAFNWHAFNWHASRQALDWMAWGINLRTRLFRTATADQCIFCRRDVFDSLDGLPDVALMEGNLFARSMRDQVRVAILGPDLRISGRRWQKNGVFRTMLLMYGIRAAHRVGVSTEVLAKVWRRLSE